MTIYEALQQNKMPFGLMETSEFTNEEMQAKANEIGIIEFQYWNFGWGTCQIRDWDDGACYRLRPDYEKIEFADKVFASTGDAEKGPNYVVGVTAHCKCGHVFVDDVVHCKPKLQGIVDVRSSDSADEEKPEIVEYRVEVRFGYLQWIDSFDVPVHPIAEAPSAPDFIGSTDGKYLWGCAYKHKVNKAIYSSILKSELKYYEVITPTHVLFHVTK